MPHLLKQQRAPSSETATCPIFFCMMLRRPTEDRDDEGCLHQHCLHTVRSVQCSDLVTNMGDLDQAGITSMEAPLRRTQERWAGPVSGMEHRLPEISLDGQLPTGLRDRGARKKR
ncbi:hypothetical protein ACOMHN_021061 [Nucella lapillus]